MIDQEELKREEARDADKEEAKEKYDSFVGKEFRSDDPSFVPAKNLSYKLTFTTPKDAGISKNLTTEIRMFLDPDADFESGRLVKEISSKEKAEAVLTDEGRSLWDIRSELILELVKCPPNLPVDLKFWLHTKSDELNLEAARLIEEVVSRNCI